ncbi:nitroreductase family deazaflavin-dependent oxidoreductase [Solirubrobacter ginsenosidimutans]|uniref:Nitroreductase family deazaflavin-dependent oxidoreductase n=1 Tax=Solirubrobacter ginsenosidimutans TaxID=490573 RepID=A0A9X3N433_9ACTN|nr:nitroreductase family deazaflavin-dependent oxidoreductase [Solirubrobacter ginsenosidimutans]MDA0166743.1 nitroreductase family deazaflavin-dependent oxidoreductase [Solirubrobacter ginsenosidimutans]
MSKIELNNQQLEALTDELRSPSGPGTSAWDPSASRTRRFNEALIEYFRQNDHKVPGNLERNLMLLTTTGAKSGQKRTVPLAFHHVDGRLVVVASMAGADRNPPWFHNIKADPRVKVEMDGETFDATAVITSGEDRDRLFAGVVAHQPSFGSYQLRTKRLIPVVELIRRS